MSSLYAFFVFAAAAHLVCCSFAYPSQCPGFTCGKLESRISFPFIRNGSGSSSSDCGPFIINCSTTDDDSHAQVLFPNHETWYSVDKMNPLERTISIIDLQLKEQLDHNHCASLSNLTLPSTPFVKFYYYHHTTLVFFKCKRLSVSGPSQNQQLVFFQSLQNYTACFDDYDLYYASPNLEKSLPLLPQTLSDRCSTIELPLNVSWEDSSEPLKNLTSLFIAQYSLRWEVVPDCYDCYFGKGGFCREKINGTLHCADGFNNPSGRPEGLRIPNGFLIAAAFVVVLGVGVFYLLRRRSKNHPNVEELLRNHLSLSPKRYKYYDVRKMTNSFKEKLGQGGYGSVFKGQLLDGRLVAVKVLDKTNKGDGEDLVNEIASISRTSHVNVVALLGFCIEGPKRALIYEFMPNGSLEKFIYNDKLSKTGFQHHQQLGWDTLFKITIGIARGLEYLHRGCYTRIVHFDIKPHNILLDQDFNPKISDFGLSKLCLKKESTMSTMGARGTIGYIAPELVLRAFGKVSHKSDVYSYGMMVLEMVGQRKNVDAGADNTSEIYFPHWIYKRLDQLEELGLGTTTTEDDKELARKMSIVGLWCIQVDPMQRPSMNKVLDMLVGRIEDLEIPPMPTFSSSAPSVHQETCSSISVS